MINIDKSGFPRPLFFYFIKLGDNSIGGIKYGINNKRSYNKMGKKNMYAL